MPSAAVEIRLVVFDLAGTTIDFGSMAPLAAFIESFARQGVAVSAAEARLPMGLNKMEHIRTMLAMPSIAQCWREVHRRGWNDADADNLYRDFMELQLAVIDRHSKVVPGLLDCLAALRKEGIRIATTTGYFREAAERVYRAMREQGYVPDCSQCAGDAPKGRPAPYMIFRIMEALRIYPPAAVLKVGDTVHDIEEGLNAGAWSAGVVRSSNEVGCTEAELAALSEADRQARLDAARRKLIRAGAHAVVDSIADVPELVRKLSAGQTCAIRAGESRNGIIDRD